MIRLTVPALGVEEFKAVERVLKSGYLVQGKEAAAFEEELASYLGCAQAVLVSSGTAALHLSLVGLGIGRGDAVIVPDFTFPATANCVELAGALPLLCDVDPVTYNITPEGIAKTMGQFNGPQSIKAVMVVHEFGCPAEMDRIMETAGQFGLMVIEDAACALGAQWREKKIGTWGCCGCFSFHPRKTITTGEGGAIATDDTALAGRIRSLRNHGMASGPKGNHFVMPGYNYRLTDFQAALGRTQLPRLDRFIDMRRELQEIYRQNLQTAGIQFPPDIPGHVWQTLMVIVPQPLNSNTVMERMRAEEIETGIGAHCIHDLPYYQDTYPVQAGELGDNVSHHLFTQGLALPLYQGLSENDVQRVCAALIKHVQW